MAGAVGGILRLQRSDEPPRAVRATSQGSKGVTDMTTRMTRRGLLPPQLKSLQSCPTLCDPIDGSPPGSSVHGILGKNSSILGKNTGVGCHFLLPRCSAREELFLRERRKKKDGYQIKKGEDTG